MGPKPSNTAPPNMFCAQNEPGTEALLSKEPLSDDEGDYEVG